MKNFRHGAETLEEARAIQAWGRSQVIHTDRLGPVRYVAGTDVGFLAGGTIAQGAVVVLRFPDLTPVESQIAQMPVTFPYIPGYLSFREVPVLLAAIAQLQQKPDLILCDGQGWAHPRRFGLACHLGLALDCPTIGVAKSHLLGEYEEPGLDKGAIVPLWDRGEEIGAVLRSRTNVKPLFISVGHRLSLPTALTYVQACVTKYRLPETTRHADRLASNR